MALAIVYSRASAGIQAPLVTVEAHLSNGMVGLNIVGLPETAVKESKHRVRSALMNSHFEFPARRITINLAPADLPKEGGRFDLPIAIGILAASGQIPPTSLAEYEFVGELALSGELRAIRGALPVALASYKADRKLIVPIINAKEAALVKQAQLFSANHLLEVCAHLKKQQVLHHCAMNETAAPCAFPELADVKGQAHAKRALEIAAAGRHSLLLIGPPGTGKTMLASRLPGILPEMNDEEALEIAAIASVTHQGFNSQTWKQIPFRAPHHTSSNAALVGGGRPPQPGEISLAHRGVLFLDELPEFHRHVLECLREPLESGMVTISRAAFQTSFPAKFQLVAAMNPCPCGFAGSVSDECRCSNEQIKRYVAKISGPLLERIDLHVEVSKLDAELFVSLDAKKEESSESVRKRVIATRQYQFLRQGKYNSDLLAVELDQYDLLHSQARTLLIESMTKFHLSARVCHRLIKIARTIADLEKCVKIYSKHLAEALNYRCLDRIRVASL